MKTIKLYELKDLENFHKNTVFYANGYDKFMLTPKNEITRFYPKEIETKASEKVRFTESLNTTTDVDLLELNNSYSNGIAKKEQEIQKLEQQIKDAKKLIVHFKKQHTRIKDAKTFVEAFEILMKD